MGIDSLPRTESRRTAARVSAAKRTEYGQDVIEVDEIVAGARWRNVRVGTLRKTRKTSQATEDIVKVGIGCTGAIHVTVDHRDSLTDARRALTAGANVAIRG